MTAAAMQGAASPYTPFSRMLEPQKEAALAELTAQVSHAGGAPGLVARLAGLLRRAPWNGTFHVELEIPRLSFFPDSRWVGQGFFEPWALDLITKPLPDGLDVQHAFWLATSCRTMPIAEAVALVADPERSPIAELDRRRAEMERRRKEGAADHAAKEAERKRAEDAEQAWMQKNRSRVAQWSKLPRHLQDIATAAGESGDERLIAFARRVIELSPASWASPRPPEFLWPLSPAG